jgi:hypothetical protein
MKKRLAIIFAAILAIVPLGSFPVKANAQEKYGTRDFHQHFQGFVPGSIVLSGTVYIGNANTVTPAEVLPYGCLNTGPVTNPNPATVNVPVLPADQPPTATPVTVSCGYASDNGEAPNLNDDHNVWNTPTPIPTSASPRPSSSGTSAPMATC